CQVALCARDGETASQTAQQIMHQTSSMTVGFGADVSRKEDVDQLLENVRNELGNPDILITNAGGPPPGTFASTKLEDYERALRLNLMSAVNLIHAVVPFMKMKKWGRIIAITSIAVKQPIGDLLLSNMARTGLTGFLKTIATELADNNITVNALLPGMHKTARVEELIKNRALVENKSIQAVTEEMLGEIPARAMGEPDDFGSVAVFLASNQARYITGQNLLIDGGKFPGLL
ncbi:MAG: SDR family oxidoreductase, partial [Desulfobacterales bacterium]|nr:SDR family oxidoreductase [Desulfobacterales bacterium]